MNIELINTRNSIFADGEVEDYHEYDIIANGEKVGSLEIIDQFNEDNDTAYVERIDIDEEYRGQGIGTAVLSDILRDTYYNVVVAPDNKDAQRLYERLGKEFVCYGDNYDFSYNNQGYGVYVI